MIQKIFSKLTYPVLLALSFLFYALAMYLVKIDVNFSNRWLSFGLWICSLIIPVVYFVLINSSRIKKKIKAFSKNEIILVVFIFALAIFTRFLLLKEYPFVAVMDEVRDGGWNARQIFDGTIKNIFGYGRYESHGLIVPTLVMPFYVFFKNSVYSYRVLTAIISVLDVMAVYFLTKTIAGKRAAFFASLVLISLPLHLYYGRTEIVVMFSSFLTTLIVFSLYYFFKNKKIEKYIILGMLFGFFSGFHASARTIVFIAVAMVLFSTIYSSIKEKNKNYFLGIVIFIFCFLIGFGPRIAFTPARVFFHSRTVALFGNNEEAGVTNVESAGLPKRLVDLRKNYIISIKAYFSRPVALHYQDTKPVLTPLLGAFFVLGIIAMLFSSSKVAKYVVLPLVFLIPLTNSAITDCINCDHRLAPILPVAALTTGLGIDTFLSLFSRGKFITKLRLKLSAVIQIALFCYIFLVGCNFFAREPASKGKSPSDFLSMHVVYLLKHFPNQKNLCLWLSPANYTVFNHMHTKEQHEFFLPGTIIETKSVAGLSDGDVYISKNCLSSTILPEEEFLEYQICYQKTKFFCPLDYAGSFKIYLEKIIARSSNG